MASYIFLLFWKALLRAVQESELSFGVFCQGLIWSLLFEWEIELPFEVKESRHNLSPPNATKQVSKHCFMCPVILASNDQDFPLFPSVGWIFSNAVS